MSAVKSAPIAASLPLFLDSYENPHTRKQYERGVCSFLAWFEQRYGHAATWSDWTVIDTREWRDSQIGTRSAATINVYLMGAAQFAQWAQAQGLLDHDPTDRVKRIRQERPTPHPLTRYQQTVFTRTLYAGDPFPRALFLTLLHTGLRASELAHLRLSDVTFGERRIPLSKTVPQGKVRVGELSVIGKGFAERAIPLNATARLAILEWMPLRPAVESPYLFVHPTKCEPITAKTLNNLCANQPYQQVVPGLHPHMLRDTFATRLQEKGVPIEIISKLLGHQNIETTARYYVASEIRPEYVDWIVDDDD